jgi:hypothetical protein
MSYSIISHLLRVAITTYSVISGLLETAFSVLIRRGPGVWASVGRDVGFKTIIFNYIKG